ncbi:hypothetical protein DPMN_081961 [Dreissena polymorpha]|uniref:Uncharacterized protein n=1 Tax=Dreissena polymorpha TaxID=45954 RepID=A0A9D4B9P5_DREPO|nr:hypothetical protein DPMN_081961 [Dreissena polymorpha]
MVCLCISCSGSGFCSNLLSFVISITFSFHSFGIVSPIWFCSGVDCKHLGLFYTCMDGSCYRRGIERR